MGDLISIIVPVYNVKLYLERCVKSICNQTYLNLQIILVDDGSTDGSGQVCDNLAEQDSRIVVVHKQNGGLSDARNAGLDIAQGEYIGFVDSDDFIEKEMYQILYNKIKNTDAEVVNIGYRRVDENNTFFSSAVKRKKDAFISNKEFLRELYLFEGDVSACTKLYKKHILEKLRFKKNICNEDLVFMFELLPQIKGIEFVAEIGYNYFIRSGSISNSGYSKTIVDMVKNAEYGMELAQNIYPDLMPCAENLYYVQVLNYMLLLPSNIMNKDNSFYLRCLKQIKLSRNNIKNNQFLSKKNKYVLLVISFYPKMINRFYKLIKRGKH